MSGYEMIEEDEDWKYFWRGVRRGYVRGCVIGLPLALVYLVLHYAGVLP